MQVELRAWFLRRILPHKILTRLFILLIGFAMLISAIIGINFQAKAANFTTKTGYYIGSGVSGMTVSGLGFQPDYVMIKSSTNAGAAVFKTSAMPANTTAYTSATIDDTGTNITLNSDGFSVGTLANVNTANVLYYYVAVGGSDCSATGNFCVGSYTGNGASPRDITVGFQPTTALVKRSTAVDGHFRVVSQPANETIFLTTTARNTTGLYIQSFSATAFRVGATDNANGGNYYYTVFKDTAGSFAQGTYAGNAVDNRSITGAGLTPNFVLVKNATSATAANRAPQMNFTQSFGDSSSYVGAATGNIVNTVQALENGGFQIGSANQVNQSGTTMYWFAIGGADPPNIGSGSFSMKTGSYVGTSASNPISGLGFKPDLVIVKANTAQLAVFRTTLMQGDSTAHMSAATANFAGGITSLDADGFTVGTAVQTNSGGVTYQWQAFGGANNPHTSNGSTDFMIGAHYGNGITGRNISPLSWQPDMVTIKRYGATAGAWRPSSQVGDSTSYFGASNPAAGIIQSFISDGFQVGNNGSANTAGSLYHWFAFKNSSNFSEGSYSGTGSIQNITTAGMRPEYVWVKRNININGVMSSVSLSGGASQYFVATANATDRITKLVKGGFRLGGAQTETNTNGGTYYYATWNNPNYGSLGLDIVDANGQTVGSPNYIQSPVAYRFSCGAIDKIIGTSAQRIQISNTTNSPAWSASIAATNGQTSLWRNVGDTERYDYNDPSQCNDSLDADSVAGQLSINASVGTITPETGCTTNGLTLGANTAFNQGVVNDIELITAGSGADADCIFELTNIAASQYLPAEQPIGQYSINLTITVVAQ